MTELLSGAEELGELQKLIYNCGPCRTKDFHIPHFYCMAFKLPLCRQNALNLNLDFQFTEFPKLKPHNIQIGKFKSKI